MGTIADKLVYLDGTKTALRNAINLRGGDIESGDTFRSYVSQLQQLIWLPDSLFAKGEQGAWYDPSDLSTLFQDATGTIPVTTDGDPVGVMLDKSGRGKHATQSVSAARPTYPGLGYDRVDDHFQLPTGLAINPSVFMCGYAAPGGFSGQRQIFELSSNGGTRGVRILVGASQWLFQAGNGGRVTISSGSVEPMAVLSLVLTGGVMKARINGVQVGQASVPGYVPNSGLSFIGKEFGAGINSFGSGDIGDLVVTEYVPSQEDIEAVERYIAQKNGVTLP